MSSVRDPELEAVEGALNALALASSDKALEKVVSRLLPGLLTALGTDSDAARKKCVETLQHINVRLRASPAVSMPFDAVLAAASAPDAVLMTRNVAIQGGYLGRCLDRHTSPGDAFKPLVVAAYGITGNLNRDALHCLALKALDARVRATPSGSNSDSIFESLLREIPVEPLTSFLNYGQQAMRSRTKVVADQSQLLALVRLCVEYAGLQTPERAVHVFPLLLVAAGTTSRGAVSSAGEDGLKRIDACDVLLEHDPNLVYTLFDVFLDSAAEIPLRCLVLSKGLLRATLSASCFPQVLLVVEQAVYKPGIPERLRGLGMQFVSFVVANGSPATLRDHAVELLRGMLKVIQDDTDGSPSFSPKVRGFAYTALAEILLRVPSLLAQHAHFTPELFFSAAQSRTEPSEVRASASHALSTLAPVFSIESSSDASLTAIRRDALLETLGRTIENTEELASGARSAAILWANVCFPFSDAAARLLCIIGGGDERPDVCEMAIAGLSPKRFRNLAFKKPDDAENIEEGGTSKSIDDNDENAAKRMKSDTAARELRKDDVVQVGAGLRTKEVVSSLEAKRTADVSFPHFVDLVDLMKRRLEGAEGREPLVLRPNSWALFLRFALFTLRRRSQVALGSRGQDDLTRPDAWRGSSGSDVSLYLQGDPALKSSLADLLEHANRCIIGEGVPGGVKVERAALCVILFVGETDIGSVAPSYSQHMDVLLSLCARKCAAGGGALVDGLSKLVGIASRSLSDEQLGSLISKLVDKLSPDPSGRAAGRHREDERESSTLCLGQVVAGLVSSPTRCMDGSQIAEAVGTIARRFQAAVESSSRVRAAACSALAAIGVTGPLPLPRSADDVPPELPVPSRAVVFSGLAGIVKSEKSDAKLVEAASNALGRLCVGEQSSDFKSIAIDALLATATLRREDEVRFTAGESIVRAAVGFDAPPPVSLRAEEDATEDEELASLLYEGHSTVSFAGLRESEGEPSGLHSAFEHGETSPSSLKAVLSSITELCYSKRPHARTGACVFLVSFLRLVGSPYASSENVAYTFSSEANMSRFKKAQEDVLDMLPQAQRAFTTLLGDRSDFAQQLAARGISLIYDMSAESEQKELVSTLVRSLTASKRGAATTVAGDEGGLLDINGMQLASTDANNASSSGGGAGAATYKELCSLATDMGQPDLVYKFLDLAGHTALWSNRRGAALAGSALLGTDMAAEQLKPHMKTLVPRLYVYSYDPAEGVRLAMASVLRSVAKAGGFDSVATAVTEHYDLVVQHCLSSMTSGQWRVREAGSGALRDLMPSRSWGEVKEHLGEFWYIGLRVMDDVKETVRTAAESTGRVLSTLSIRLCDPNLSGVTTASAAVAVVVPAVLAASTHGVKEIRVLATTTLSKVIRHGGDALRSSVPDIMTSLLESATELEPQALNYVQFHVDEDQRDSLETMRADAASMSSSPVIDSLERLAVLVDEQIAGEVALRLIRLARTGVGVPTRAATARLFCSLLSTRGVVMTPHAAKMMHSAMNAARMESSSYARRAWSNAVGMAARLAPVEAVAKLAASIVELSGADAAQDRALASYIALGLWQNSAETARKHATQILPVAYMGRYETDDGLKGVATNWRTVWNEGSPSSDAGLRLFAAEITDSCVARLATSSQYKVKRSAATALGSMAVALSSGTATAVSNASMAKAAKALVDALPGHIWDGKDAALTAIGTIASSANESGEGAQERKRELWSLVGGPGAVVVALLKECARGKKEYRMSAMSALSIVLAGCRDKEDFVSLIAEALAPEWERDAAHGGTHSSNSVGIGMATDEPDVATSVWETGSDANAVDARTKARKAQRAATVSAIDCLESAFPSQNCASVQQQHVDRVLQTLCKLVGSEREVRTAALQHLASIVGRLDEKLLVDDKVKDVVGSALRGVGDARYSGVRGAGYGLMLQVLERTSPERLNEAVAAFAGREVLKNAWSLDSSKSAEAKRLREEAPALYA